MSILVPLSPVLEVYYGKPSEFKKIETLLVPVIEACHKAASVNIKKTNINSMPEVKEIEKILTNFFKVDEVSLSFYSGSTIISIASRNIPGADNLLPPAFNAFTIPTGFAYLRQDPNNTKLASPHDLFVNVNIDILLVHHLNLTPDELLALMLHEIGHDFDASFWGFILDMFLIALNPLNLVIKFLLTNKITVKNIFQKSHKAILWLSENIPPFKILNNAIEKIILDISPLMHLDRIAGIPGALIRALFLPNNIKGYIGERFADSFASSYGYGEPLSRSLNKIENEEYSEIIKLMQDSKILNIGYDLSKTLMRTVFFALDVHPDNALRVQYQLDKLRRDIKDPNLSPATRKELNDQIKKIEKFVDEVMTSKEYAKEKGLYFTTLFNHITMKTFKGKCDPRELILMGTAADNEL